MQASGAPEPSISQAADIWDSLQPDDVRVAASLCHDALAPLADADWTCPAGGLEWDCRWTLEHTANALDVYALLLATPSPEPFWSPRARYPEKSIADLLTIVQRRAAILAQLAATADPGARGFHVWGRSDPPGYVAMGCAEILLHTGDIVLGFMQGDVSGGAPSFRPPDALCERVVRRLFPWAPTDVDGWSALRWASGRLNLPGHERAPANWAWHASPVSEWDGTPKTHGD